MAQVLKTTICNSCNPIFIIGVFLLFLVSCRPIYYIPNTQNVPLIQEKGEGNVNISASQSQMELKAAYGVGKSIAIQADVVMIVPNVYLDLTNASGYLYEGGVGYFKNFGTNFLFDTYVILGAGSVENHLFYSENSTRYIGGDLTANYRRYAIQPSFSVIYDYVSVSASMRCAALDYYNVEGNLHYYDRLERDYLRSRSPFFLLEPALTLRGGFKKFKLELQYIYSFNLTAPNFPQKNKIFSMGVNFHF